MTNIINQIVRFLSGVFFVPSAWLTWPNIIYMLAVPMLLIWYAIKNLLDIIGIFRFSGSVNSIIAAVVAFFLLPVAQFTSYGAAMFIFITLPGLKKKITFAILLLVFYFIIVPLLAQIKI